MPKESGINQKLKFLYLSRIFMNETDEEHPLTVYELIERLEELGINASRKTLLEDIGLLCDFGMDIIAVRIGRMYGYYLGTREFELPEIKLLADAVSSARFITEKKSRQLLKKLGRLAGKYHGREINRRVHVANRIKTENELIYINVDTLQRAIDKKKQVHFSYFDRTAAHGKEYREGGRTCSPYALTWNDGSYYLVGKQEKYDTLSNFRVDRMEKVEILSAKAEPIDENFDLAEYMNTSFSMFSGNECTVTLRMKNSLVNSVTDKFGADIIMIPEEKDSFTVSVKVISAPAFYGWMFQFGADAEIVSPQSMREEYAEMLKKVQQLYKVKKS